MPCFQKSGLDGGTGGTGHVSFTLIIPVLSTFGEVNFGEVKDRGEGKWKRKMRREPGTVLIPALGSVPGRQQAFNGCP